ncbi:hypothetical protein ES703_89248 [subsurface metagenome]
MPGAPGTYRGYIDVFAEGMRFLAYQAIEDVVIVVPAKAQFYVPAMMEVKVTDGLILGMYWRCEFSCSITNNGNAPGTHNITWQDQHGRGGSAQITLNPGETYPWSWSADIDFREVIPPLVCELWGDWEGDNYSRGEATPEMAVITPAIEIRAVIWDKSPPHFAPGTTHTAKATMRNPTTRPWDYTGVLRMGTDQVAMAEAAFHLNSGEIKEVAFRVVMPSAEGEYPVYLDVSSGGQLLAHQATASVVVTYSWEFTGSLVGKCTGYWMDVPGCAEADIEYSISNPSAPNFRWTLIYWDIYYTNTYSRAGNGPASGKISCSGGARLYAHPDPNARLQGYWSEAGGFVQTSDFKVVASISVGGLE